MENALVFETEKMEVLELPMVSLYIPEKYEVLQISEGGSSIDREDRDNGIVDYLYLARYDINNLTAGEIGGGQLDMREYISDKYNSLTEAIPEVLDFIYDNKDIPYIQLYPVYEE